MAKAKDRMDGSLAPGVKLRAAIRCFTVPITLAIRLSPAALVAFSCIRTGTFSMTVPLNCTLLSLEQPAIRPDTGEKGASV